jgi:ribokinase
MSEPLAISVIGHVEHVTLGEVAAVPRAGQIAHLSNVVAIPGGGGGVSYYQLTKSPAEVHLFTAVGHDATGDEIESWLLRSSGTLHAVRRAEAHTRDVVMLTPDGERTIAVVGQPLHPRRDDPLPWAILRTCDAVYFTAQDPELIKEARGAKLLVVSARRREALVKSKVRADVVVGSARDEREASTLADYPVPPRYLVMTEGADGGSIHSADGTTRFPPGKPTAPVRSSYGAGDSFTGALVYFLATGLPIMQACAKAADFGAAVLASSDTITAQGTLASTT